MSRREWTPEQMEAMRGPEAHVRLAELWGVGEGVVRRWRKKHGWSAPAVATPLQREVFGEDAERDELVILRDENRALRARARRAERANVGDERVLRAIEAAVHNTEAVDLPRVILPPIGSGAVRHEHIAVWSDWHYGEIVDSAQMNGLNAYNVGIAEERVESMVRSILSFKRVGPEVKRLHIWALGDMASGDIHDLEATNEVPAAQQYVGVGHLMGAAIEQLAEHYESIECVGTFGNHPRAQDKPVSKDGYNNGDWIAYQVAAARTSRLPNVTWQIPSSGMVVCTVAGRNFLLWHGDGVRTTMPGVPWGGIARRVNVLKDTYASMGIRLDHVVVGHFHQRCIVPGVYMNGSLIGPNEYGIKNFGGGEAPKQLLLEFDTKRQRETSIKTITFDHA